MPPVNLIWRVCQVVGGVPCYRWGGDLLAVSDSAPHTVCVQLGLLCGSVRGGILPLHPVLRGGGGAGDPHPPAALLQVPVELSGYSHSCGERQSCVLDFFLRIVFFITSLTDFLVCSLCLFLS